MEKTPLEHFDFSTTTQAPVFNTTAVLDSERTPLDNYLSMTHFIARMPLADRVDMLSTLLSYCRSQLHGF